MLIQNPFTKQLTEYPVELLNLSHYEFFITHETPFSERRSEWFVVILKNADTLYIPGSSNRSRNAYIVTWEHTSKQLPFPHGIYAIPMNHFTTEW
jgi:hypothetical protein